MIPFVTISVTGVTICLQFIALGWMFIGRLRTAMKLSHTGGQPSFGLDILQEKSSVVAVTSVVCYMVSVSLTIALDSPMIMTINSCLNLVFLYCLFNVGSKMYRRMFTPMVRYTLGSRSLITPSLHSIPSNTATHQHQRTQSGL